MSHYDNNIDGVYRFEGYPFGRRKTLLPDIPEGTELGYFYPDELNPPLVAGSKFGVDFFDKSNGRQLFTATARNSVIIASKSNTGENHLRVTDFRSGDNLLIGLPQEVLDDLTQQGIPKMLVQ